MKSSPKKKRGKCKITVPTLIGTYYDCDVFVSNSIGYKYAEFQKILKELINSLKK